MGGTRKKPCAHFLSNLLMLRLTQTKKKVVGKRKHGVDDDSEPLKLHHLDYTVAVDSCFKVVSKALNPKEDIVILLTIVSFIFSSFTLLVALKCIMHAIE